MTVLKNVKRSSLTPISGAAFLFAATLIVTGEAAGNAGDLREAIDQFGLPPVTADAMEEFEDLRPPLAPDGMIMCPGRIFPQYIGLFRNNGSGNSGIDDYRSYYQGDIPKEGQLIRWLLEKDIITLRHHSGKQWVDSIPFAFNKSQPGHLQALDKLSSFSPAKMRSWLKKGSYPRQGVSSIRTLKKTRKHEMVCRYPKNKNLFIDFGKHPHYPFVYKSAIRRNALGASPAFVVIANEVEDAVLTVSTYPHPYSGHARHPDRGNDTQGVFPTTQAQATSGNEFVLEAGEGIPIKQLHIVGLNLSIGGGEQVDITSSCNVEDNTCYGHGTNSNSGFCYDPEYNLLVADSRRPTLLVIAREKEGDQIYCAVNPTTVDYRSPAPYLGSEDMRSLPEGSGL